MKKLKSLAHFSLLGAGLAVGMMTQAQAKPSPGQCEISGGGAPLNYHVTFDRTFDSPDKNSGGQVFANVAQAWEKGESYRGECGCTRMSASYILALTPGNYHSPQEVKGRGVQNFYTLTGSTDFAVASEVYIGGARSSYIQVPFERYESNGNTGANQLCTDLKYSSGAKGFVHLYFIRPVIGTSRIEKSTIVDIYINSDPSAGRGSKMASVTMSGTITVPQKCELKNSVITVPFGEIMSNAFKVKGKMPEGFESRVHEETLSLECSNLSTRAKISLQFEGEANRHETSALKTYTTSGSVTAANDDIAIVIKDKATDKVISPAKGLLPLKMNGLGNIDSNSEATLLFYPISATGKAPKVGEFEATATITVAME